MNYDPRRPLVGTSIAIATIDDLVIGGTEGPAEPDGKASDFSALVAVRLIEEGAASVYCDAINQEVGAH